MCGRDRGAGAWRGVDGGGHGDRASGLADDGRMAVKWSRYWWCGRWFLALIVDDSHTGIKVAVGPLFGVPVDACVMGIGRLSIIVGRIET